MRFSRVATAAILVTAGAGQALAGGFAPAIVAGEALVVVEPEPPRSSSYGILLPLLLVGGLVAAASSNDRS